MKKMVCEICGSQSIRKNGDVFVCQECGTEYTLDEAKKLLTEIQMDGNEVQANGHPSKNISKKIISENDKYELLKKLSLWANILQLMNSFVEFDFLTTEESIWQYDEESIGGLKNLLPETITAKQIISMYSFQTYGKPFHDHVYKYYCTKMYLKKDEIPFNIVNFYNTWKERLSHKYEKNNHSIEIGLAIYFTTNSDCGDLLLDIKQLPLSTWCSKLITYPFPKVPKFEISRSSLFIREKHYLNDFANQLMSIVESKTKIYKEEKTKILLPMIEKRRIELLKVINVAKEMVPVFDLPVKYRSLDAVLFMMESIYDGKVETWKEAVLLYDETVFRTNVLSQLDEISNKLSVINNKISIGLSVISNQISKMNSLLAELNTSVSESNTSLKAIAAFSALQII